MFVFITTLIAIFKKENGHRLEDDHVKLNIFQNYKMIWDILKLPSVRILAIALVTVKVNQIWFKIIINLLISHIFQNSYPNSKRFHIS